MKKIVMIVSVAIASIGFSYAQQGQQQQGQTQEQMDGQQEGLFREFQDNERSEIEESELPASIQNELQADLRDWEVEDVYRIEEEAKRETGVAYEVRVEKGDEKKKLFFNEEGQLLGTKGPKEGHDKEGHGHQQDDERRRGVN
jgi:hypothetical protein